LHPYSKKSTIEKSCAKYRLVSYENKRKEYGQFLSHTFVVMLIISYHQLEHINTSHTSCEMCLAASTVDNLDLPQVLSFAFNALFVFTILVLSLYSLQYISKLNKLSLARAPPIF